jgi:hypothetical protein
MIALKCPDIEVVVLDINETRINAWNSDNVSESPLAYRDWHAAFASGCGPGGLGLGVGWVCCGPMARFPTRCCG